MKMYTLLALLCVCFSTSLFAQKGIGTKLPDKSAALEIVSNQRGLLIPRIDIPDLSLPAPVTNPANALMVYNKGTSGTTPGFYYWNAAANGNNGAWIPLAVSQTTPSGHIGVGGGAHIDVDTIVVGTQTSFMVSLKGGNHDGQLLVTQIQNNDTITAWVDRALSLAISTSSTINSTNFTNYTPYIQTVTIAVDVADLSGNGIDLTLPDPAIAESQVITVKLTDPTTHGESDNYLTIYDGPDVLTYGALPFQAWTLRSNGASWTIVASN